MKKIIAALTLGTLCFFAANVSNAQPGSAENLVRAQAQAFSESDVFYNVDTDTNYKAAAFSDADAEGTVKCWRWYYRPYYRYYTWRPVYYRPAYYYYSYYVPTWYISCSWTNVVVYKGASGSGAMINSDPPANSPLAAKGLRKGDIITAINGQPLTNLADLKQVASDAELTVHKGNNVKYAGNLLKNADADYMKNFEGMQETEAGTLMTKAEIQAGNYDMYKFYEQKTGPTFGVRAVDNNGNGVKITEVVAGQPGQKSGFEVNDVILEINGTKIGSEAAYSEAIDRSGSVARMKVLCGKTGQTLDTDVILNK